MSQIPDKFIVIGILQNILQGIEQAGTMQKSEKGKGVFMGLFVCLRYCHTAITGNEFQGSPKDLVDWTNRYVNEQASAAGRRN